MTTLLPGLEDDAVVVKRPGTALDAEGNPTMALTTVGTIAGTWGSPSYRDIARATQAGQMVDGVVATTSAVPHLDDVLEVRGKAYKVTTVGDARFHYRYGIRRIE